VPFAGSLASSLADPVAGVPAQSGSDGASAGYVPSPVSFVSPDGDDDDYDAGSSYGTRAAGDRDRDADAPSTGSASWKDSGRAGKQDTVFDVSAGRRRPVVFEEDDDLDVPDFLK
jgi:cell division protein FtsZ